MDMQLKTQTRTQIQIQGNDVMQETEICPMCGKPVEYRTATLFGKEERYKIACSCMRDSYLSMQEEKKKQEKQKKKQEEIERYNRWSKHEIGKRFQNSSFENFQQDDKNKLVFNYIKMFSDTFGSFLERGTGYVIMGNPGNGKTHLAVSVMKALTEKGYSVAFVNASSLIGKFKEYESFSKQETLDDFVRFLTVPDLLILDDLGANRWSDLTKDYIYKVIDARYKEMKPILVTTNIAEKDLVSQLSERITDRLKGACSFIQIKSKSMRVALQACDAKVIVEEIRAIRN